MSSSDRRHRAAAVLAACLAAACRTAPSPAAAGTVAAPTARAGRAPAGPDLSALDRNTGPCADFYQYACGGWMSRMVLPPDKSRYELSFTVIDERNLAVQREIAEADAAGKLDPEDRFPDKVGDFWAACMDEAGIERRGLGDLEAAFARLEAVQDPGALAEALGWLHRQGVSAAFDIGSEQDARDATQVIGLVAQGGLSLPDRDYYLKGDPASVAIQEAYRRHLARMLELAGEPAEGAAADAAAVYGLERELAESHWSRVEMRDPQRIYNRVELAGLERLAPHLDWGRFLAALGHPDLRAFDTTTPRMLERLDGLITSRPMATWRAYLRWNLLTTMAGLRALPRAFTEERFAFVSRSFTGAKQLEPRWKICVRATKGALGEALGQAFARRTFGAEGKARSRELVGGIEAAMHQRLEEVPWMDAPTRREALEKLGKVGNKIGYPDRWRDYGPLAVDRDSFFRSLLAADAFEVNRDLEKIGKPLDRQEWLMAPSTVNAYYDPGMNEMVFPAGILQPPFFSREAADAANYGAIGMVMGHELTHGFDDQGRQYDADGNLRDWWTAAVSQDFDRRAACVVDQYDGYLAVEDVKVNGKLTLGENIADLGGIKLAYAAWQAARQGKPPGPRRADFSPEQTFFLAFAQGWCQVLRPEQARTWSATDPHSPNKWRVNGPLSNFPAFAEAFSCPAGSPMVRAERCDPW